MDEIELLIDLHAGNVRQGPGGDEETRRAIELARLDPDAPLTIADVGCGTGATTLVLARALNARVTAIDALPAFIERLRERADREGLGNRIQAQVGNMASLPFDEDALDVLWSEAAIYNMGFEAGIRAWRRFLRPNGVLVVSELTWTSSTRPVEVERHWRAEYPGITTASENIRMLEEAGYRPLGFFFLPPRCWANYYEPLRRAFQGFLERHEQSEKAQQIVAAEQKEIELYRERGEWYGYAFYIARKGRDEL